jgi:hypothetical protein
MIRVHGKNVHIYRCWKDAVIDEGGLEKDVAGINDGSEDIDVGRMCEVSKGSSES